MLSIHTRSIAPYRFVRSYITPARADLRGPTEPSELYDTLRERSRQWAPTKTSTTAVDMRVVDSSSGVR